MTPAKEIDGELWVRASDMNVAIAEAVAAEREECAKVADTYEQASNMKKASGFALLARECAAAIRSRT